MKPTRTRGDACASDLTFDRWLAGDLDPEREASTRTHVEACARCNARWTRLQEEHRVFAERPLPNVVAKRPPTRRPWLYSSAATMALAAAAAIFLFLRPHPPDGGGDGERTKGGLALGLFVKRGERVFAESSEEPLQAGDAIRFKLTSAEDSFVAVLSLDGALHGNIYFPVESPVATKLAAGVDVVLPGSTVLDDTLGAETIYALSCEAPVELEPVRAALENTRALPELAACKSTMVRIRKVQASP